MYDTVRSLLILDRATFVMLLIWMPVMAIAAVVDVAVRRAQHRAAAGPPRSQASGSFSAAAAGKKLLGLLIATGVTPNQITISGLVLVVLNCAYYLYHRDATMLGIGLILSYIFDALDGLIARTTGRTSRFGGYLDAVVDRFQETVTLCVVGIVTDLWLPTFLAITGSLLTSYNKARAAIEIPIANKGWPDFFDKTVRQFFLCFALIATDAIPWALSGGLWFLAAAAYFTATQRIIRAYLLIEAHDNVAPPPGKS